MVVYECKRFGATRLKRTGLASRGALHQQMGRRSDNIPHRAASISLERGVGARQCFIQSTIAMATGSHEWVPSAGCHNARGFPGALLVHWPASSVSVLPGGRGRFLEIRRGRGCKVQPNRVRLEKHATQPCGSRQAPLPRRTTVFFLGGDLIENPNPPSAHTPLRNRRLYRDAWRSDLLACVV